MAVIVEHAETPAPIQLLLLRAAPRKPRRPRAITAGANPIWCRRRDDGRRVERVLLPSKRGSRTRRAVPRPHARRRTWKPASLAVRSQRDGPVSGQGVESIGNGVRPARRTARPTAGRPRRKQSAPWSAPRNRRTRGRPPRGSRSNRGALRPRSERRIARARTPARFRRFRRSRRRTSGSDRGRGGRSRSGRAQPAEAGVGGNHLGERADGVTGIGAGLSQGIGEEGGGGGFAVHAGDADYALAPLQRGENHGAADDRDAFAAGGLRIRDWRREWRTNRRPRPGFGARGAGPGSCGRG